MSMFARQRAGTVFLKYKYFRAPARGFLISMFARQRVRKIFIHKCFRAPAREYFYFHVRALAQEQILYVFFARLREGILHCHVRASARKKHSYL